MVDNLPAHAGSPEQDPRVYFAAERTFLAWIRTGLALMGFGFVVARFGLFLRELGMQGARAAQESARHSGASLYLGTGLVVLGVIVDVGATVVHVRQVRQLAAGTWIAGRISKSAIAVALVLAASGIGLAIYLIFVR